MTENLVIPSVNIEDEMKQSFLDYAMSVIVSRALPDVRDGLFYRCGSNTRFLLYPTQNASSGTHSQMTWMTHDIEADVARSQSPRSGL